MPEYIFNIMEIALSSVTSEKHLYLDASVAAEMLKKVVLHSVATAFANIVFPVPGGPNMSTPYNEMFWACYSAKQMDNNCAIKMQHVSMQ